MIKLIVLYFYAVKESFYILISKFIVKTKFLLGYDFNDTFIKNYETALNVLQEKMKEEKI
jgi:hypothetical protein